MPNNPSPLGLQGSHVQSSRWQPAAVLGMQARGWQMPSCVCRTGRPDLQAPEEHRRPPNQHQGPAGALSTRWTLCGPSKLCLATAMPVRRYALRLQDECVDCALVWAHLTLASTSAGWLLGHLECDTEARLQFLVAKPDEWVQLDTTRTPYPQITSPPHDAAKTAFQTPRQDCLLTRLRGEGVPDLFTPRAGLASTL